MIRTIFESPQRNFKWIDVFNPTLEHLQEVARTFNLHPMAVQDCMDPAHLPKVENFGDTIFFILRAYDTNSSLEADTVQELTRKIAIFSGPGFFITIHRSDQPFLARIRECWQHEPIDPKVVDLNGRLINQILREIFIGFKKPLEQASFTIDQLQDQFFKNQPNSGFIRELFLWQQKISALKRVLRLSIDNVVPQLGQFYSSSRTQIQDVRDEAERIYFYADEIGDEAASILNVHLSISTHRTNEIMRLLTVFSVFFMPLNFIVGLYGMNFENMPELKHPNGYGFVLIVMSLIVALIYYWFRRKGWLRT